MNILCIKTGDGYDFYCMLKQAEIEVQSTSNRKLPNFYEKVTDFLLESYRISKWWQNHAFTEARRCCYKYLILTCRTVWIFIQIHCLFMHLCRLFIQLARLEKQTGYLDMLNRLFRKAKQPVWTCQTSYLFYHSIFRINHKKEHTRLHGIALFCIFALVDKTLNKVLWQTTRNKERERCINRRLTHCLSSPYWFSAAALSICRLQMISI